MDIDLISQGRQVINNAPVNENQDVKINNSEDMNKKNDNVSNSEKKQIKNSVNNLNKLLQKENTHVEYKIHKYFGDVILKIVDNNTKEVVKEMPPEKILDMIQKMCEMDGLFVDKKA